MDRKAASLVADRKSTGRPRGKLSAKSVWRRIRQPLVQSRVAKNVIASLISGGLRFVRLTNPLVPESRALMDGQYAALEPVIIALWHGQHLMAPTIYPSKRDLVAMVSRSADAELNAMVIERFGIDTVRGSGGRGDSRSSEKGGAKALIALKKALDAGKNVCMIADIPHGTPRDSGMGIILLARLSGRPIVPAAITTSRRRILERSWDKTAINLPFGRSSIVAGTPVIVSPDATEAEMEEKRLELTASLNAATAEAHRLVGGRA